MSGQAPPVGFVGRLVGLAQKWLVDVVAHVAYSALGALGAYYTEQLRADPKRIATPETVPPLDPDLLHQVVRFGMRQIMYSMVAGLAGGALVCIWQMLRHRRRAFPTRGTSDIAGATRIIMRTFLLGALLAYGTMLVLSGAPIWTFIWPLQASAPQLYVWGFIAACCLGSIVCTWAFLGLVVFFLPPSTRILAAPFGLRFVFRQFSR